MQLRYYFENEDVVVRQVGPEKAAGSGQCHSFLFRRAVDQTQAWGCPRLSSSSYKKSK
jgi:hypothetical protein